MPSPFPGMDPFLQDVTLWPVFHHEFVWCLHQMLKPSLIDRYCSRVEQRRFVAEGAGKEHQEDYLEIRQRMDDRLIALIDVVSPANKLTSSGRTAYLDQRRGAKNANASIVEIDLILRGQPTLEYSRDGLPHWHYAITVTRSTHPERFEIYTSTLQKKLPRFRLPLASDDRDTVIDLQSAFTRCYDQGSFTENIDYRCDPPAQLAEEDRRWIDGLLTEKRLRERHPDQEEIACAAYRLWEQEGGLHGHDKEHWYRAIEQLKQVRPNRTGGG